jgi:DNA (cytosine-5)-methyltransferase 1
VPVYYNENDPEIAERLGYNIAAGLIAPGEVDVRSIAQVQPDDLKGFHQAHFFAGIGGWPFSLRRAGWPDDRAAWTGSCPCGPFSQIGRLKGFADDRHLWPTWRPLIEKCRPPIIFGEQSSRATDWLRLVRDDLETMEYAVGAMPIPAACAGAFHLRDRYFWVAAGNLDNAMCTRLERYAGDGHPAQGRPIQDRSIASPSGQLKISNRKTVELQWALGADKKVRPVGPGLRLLAHGIPDRIRRIQLHGFGNAIDTRPAAEFIAATAEALNISRAHE